MSPKIAILVLCVLGSSRSATAQTKFGAVWDPPSDPLEAEADLTAMKSMGFTAVRTGLVADPTILTIADSLGLEVYQELSAFLLTGPELTAEAPRLRDALGQALAMADGHASASWFGLAYAPATDRASTCRVLSSLVDFARARAAPSVRFYYVSWLPETDQCGSLVDLVLLDDANHDRPASLLTRRRVSSPVGLAAVGRAVIPDGPSGSANRGSEEEQARFLAETIPVLRESRADVVFLYRWQDPGDLEPFHAAPLRRAFGLQDASGRARRARHVAERSLTTGQTVFAMQDGVKEDRAAGWYLFAGWLVYLAIAVMLGVSNRFRAMAPRYFTAHGFYRNAVYEGRDNPGLHAAALLALFGVTVGLLSWQTMVVVTDESALHALWFRSSAEMRAAMDALVGNPTLLTLLAGSMGLVAMVVWLSVWSIAANRHSRLRASQALLFAVWPRWPMLILLLASMLLVATRPDNTRSLTLVLAVAWGGSALWGTARSNADLARVTHMNPVLTLLYWLLSPTVILACVVAGFAALRPEVAALYAALIDW